MMITKINEEDLDSLKEKLFNNLLTGYDCLSESSAFRNQEEYELIGEQFHAGNEEFFDRLIKITNIKKVDSIYIFEYRIEANKINIIEGYKVQNNIDYWEFSELGDKLMFTINGSKFLFVDPTFTWCIITLVDIQLLYGDIIFVKAYFNNNAEKKEVIKDFNEFLNEPNRKMSYKNLSRLIKYKINEN